MQEPTLAKHQKAEHDCISKCNKKSAIELHNNIYSSPMEGLKIQLKLLCTAEKYERRLTKLEQQWQKNKQKNQTNNNTKNHNNKTLLQKQEDIYPKKSPRKRSEQ